MHTRKQYLNGEVSHEQYNRQFVIDTHTRGVTRFFGVDKLVKAYLEDKYFNTIALPKWDRAATVLVNQKSVDDRLRECGDWLTLASQVCVLKTAARIVANERLQQDGDSPPYLVGKIVTVRENPNQIVTIDVQEQDGRLLIGPIISIENPTYLRVGKMIDVWTDDESLAVHEGETKWTG